MRHVLVVEVFPCRGIGEEKAGIAMSHKVMDCIGLEIMEDGHCNSAVGNRRQGRHGPLGTVTATHGNLVALTKAGMFEGEVKFCYLSGNIFICQRHAVIVAQSRPVPVVAEALLDISCEGILVFHSVFVLILCKFN